MERIVTSAALASDQLLGRCLMSIATHWPVPVTAYVDHGALTGCMCRTDDIAGWPETKARLPMTGRPQGFKPLNYIWNAQRYAVKPFVWVDAASRMSRGTLMWLDADTVITKDIQQGFMSALLDGTDVAYLGRGGMHPETGCVVFRIPEALPLLRWCRSAYQLGGFRRLIDGWTDCHVLRAGLAAVSGVTARDLSSHTYDGEWTSRIDAFARSPLGPYIQHLKGSRAKREAVA